MKKVLFVIESLAGGGAEKVLSTIVPRLDKTKYAVTVLTVVHTGVYLPEVEAACEVRWMLEDYDRIKSPLGKLKYKLDYRWIYSQAPEKVYRRYIREKYDVEIAFVEGFATRLVAASTNPQSRKLAWVHIDMERRPYADNYFASLNEEIITYQRFNQIICVSEAVKAKFVQKFFPTVEPKVIFNPIDSEEIKKKAEENPVKRTDNLCMIAVGRLTEQKGFDRLIDALSEVSSNNSYTLRIIGEGEDRQRLENKIIEFGLEDKIEIIGFVKNPYRWMISSDVFICSSRAEGFSLVIAEALILGKPIISVACSGPTELLDGGKYGLLIPNNDTDLKRTINKLVNGEIDLKEYSKKAIDRQSIFDIVKIIYQIEEALG